MHAKLIRMLVLINVFIVMFGCSGHDANNESNPDSENKEEISSVWRLNESPARYGIYIELGGNGALEHKTIHAGALCRESFIIDSLVVVYGDPATDDVIGVQYVNEVGVSTTVEINRQPDNVFKYHPLCENSVSWNGIYKQNRSGRLPDYYWKIDVPNTIGYFWDKLNGCFSSIELEEWYMSSLYIGPGELVFDAVYEMGGVSHIAYLEKIYENNIEISPICSDN